MSKLVLIALTVVVLARSSGALVTNAGVLHAQARGARVPASTSMSLGPHTVALGAAAFSAAAMEWDAVSARERPLTPREMLAAVSPKRLASLFATLAAHTSGFAPVLTGLLLLTSWLAPQASCTIAVGWNAGRCAYLLAYKNLPEERRLPISFAANVLVVAILGGLSFFNGLKAVALLA